MDRQPGNYNGIFLGAGRTKIYTNNKHKIWGLEENMVPARLHDPISVLAQIPRVKLAKKGLLAQLYGLAQPRYRSK